MHLFANREPHRREASGRSCGHFAFTREERPITTRSVSEKTDQPCARTTSRLLIPRLDRHALAALRYGLIDAEAVEPQLLRASRPAPET